MELKGWESRVKTRLPNGCLVISQSFAIYQMDQMFLFPAGDFSFELYQGMRFCRKGIGSQGVKISNMEIYAYQLPAWLGQTWSI